MLGLPSEKGVQGVLLDHRGAIRLANGYYAWVHFPATGLFLLWLYCRRPAHYRWIRKVMTLLTGSALLLHLVAPLAPPRMLARAGMTDTAHVWGPAVYGDPRTDAAANQYAAMPSLHVGWAVVVAVALIVVSHGRGRWLWPAHPVLTVLVVVATANHYWLDGALACVLVAGAFWVVRRPQCEPHPPVRPKRPTPICGRERRSAGESSHRSWRPRPFVGGLCGDAAGPVDGERSARPPARLCASLCAIPRGVTPGPDITRGRGLPDSGTGEANRRLGSRARGTQRKPRDVPQREGRGRSPSIGGRRSTRPTRTAPSDPGGNHHGLSRTSRPACHPRRPGGTRPVPAPPPTGPRGARSGVECHAPGAACATRQRATASHQHHGGVSGTDDHRCGGRDGDMVALQARLRLAA
ncbi:phosphatase PAP2 family protein [Streptomyces griseorubiginosus]|uniref:phosphatase PAP2 family protein n=1 Tax=Streptomyces griseorubiginosus TaxID=67304 RepID=UPI003D9DB8C5